MRLPSATGTASSFEGPYYDSVETAVPEVTREFVETKDIAIMKVSLRSHVFETNSSSIHAISVDRERYVESRPDEIDAIVTGAFGQSRKVLTHPKDKLSYLWTCILETGSDIDFWYYYLVDTLDLEDNIPFATYKSNGEFNDSLEDLDITFDEWDSLYRECFIDRPDKVKPFVKSMRNPRLLRDFIYGNGVVVCDVDCDITETAAEYGIDMDTVDDGAWYSFGIVNGKKSYLYIKGE